MTPDAIQPGRDPEKPQSLAEPAPAQLNGQQIDPAGPESATPVAVEAQGVSLRNTDQTGGLPSAQSGRNLSERERPTQPIAGPVMPSVPVTLRKEVRFSETGTKTADAATSPAQPDHQPRQIGSATESQTTAQVVYVPPADTVSSGREPTQRPSEQPQKEVADASLIRNNTGEVREVFPADASTENGDTPDTRDDRDRQGKTLNGKTGDPEIEDVRKPAGGSTQQQPDSVTEKPIGATTSEGSFAVISDTNTQYLGEARKTYAEPMRVAVDNLRTQLGSTVAQGEPPSQNDLQRLQEEGHILNFGPNNIVMSLPGDRTKVMVIPYTPAFDNSEIPAAERFYSQQMMATLFPHNFPQMYASYPRDVNRSGIGIIDVRNGGYIEDRIFPSKRNIVDGALSLDHVYGFYFGKGLTISPNFTVRDGENNKIGREGGMYFFGGVGTHQLDQLSKESILDWMESSTDEMYGEEVEDKEYTEKDVARVLYSHSRLRELAMSTQKYTRALLDTVPRPDASSKYIDLTADEESILKDQWTEFSRVRALKDISTPLIEDRKDGQPILPKNTLIYSVPYSPEMIRQISTSGILSGDFTGNPQEDGSQFCVDLLKVPHNMTLQQFQEWITQLEARSDSPPGTVSLGLVTPSTTDKRVSFIVDGIHPQLTGLLGQDIRSDTADPQLLKLVNGKIRTFPQDIDPTYRQSSVLFGIPSNAITAYVRSLAISDEEAFVLAHAFTDRVARYTGDGKRKGLKKI